MQKLKTRPEKTRGASRNLTVAIKCGANLLPVKGLLYAMLHAKASRHVSGSSKQNVQIALRRLSKYIKELTDFARDLQQLQDPSGAALYRNLRMAILAYVDLFYTLSTEERDSFLTSCTSHHGKKIPHEQNLLLIPAIMASRGEPKSAVANYLTNAVYKIPFRVLYHSSKAAIHIELLQQAMGLKNAPDHLVKRFSEVLCKIEMCMAGIEQGNLRPEIDEMLKQEFIEEAVHMSHSTDMKVADFMSEKIMPNAFTERLAKRIIRRL